MTDQIDISVIMSSYNNEDTVLDAVGSILEQTWPSFQLLVVNDASTDNTRAKLDTIDDPRLTVIDNAANMGLTKSLNLAISKSSGRYIARQDADDISLSGRLEKQLKYMDAHPDIAVLGTGRATINEQGGVVSSLLLPEKPSVADLVKSNCFVHGSVMIRRDVLQYVGGYNEDFRYTQDYELWLRIASKYRVENLQEPLYGVRRHDKRVTLTKLPQAVLYRILARNMHAGFVASDLVEGIHERGIESYYDVLNKHERVEFHSSAVSKYQKNALYREAIKHLLELIRLKPYAVSLIYKLIICRIKEWRDNA